MPNKYDFGGWATKYNVKCSDQRVIESDAFAHHDGAVVPLVWNHSHEGPESVIGKVTLKHCDEGVYGYGEFNENPTANMAKGLVKHGDITSLSIFANKLQQEGCYVKHGMIREVSLVLAGANPSASIQEVLIHGAEEDGVSAVIYNDPEILDDGGELQHSAEPAKDEKDETVGDIYDTLTDKQKKAVAVIIDEIVNEGEEEDEMKQNVFDNNKQDEMKHGAIVFSDVINDAKKCGSAKEAFLAHANEYGIANIDVLFPEAKNITNEPAFYDVDHSWVASVLNGAKKSPFSRIRSVLADLTADEARARGYIKGNLKKEEVFSLLKRTTDPTTIYKKQKLDRDDIIDITDFNVVAWMKKEMRMKLDVEIARAILIGDGRQAMSDDKIKEDCLRPIYNDSDLYCIKQAIASGPNKAKEFIIACLKARAGYEGTGMPTLYTTEEMLTEMLLIEDNNGRFIYENEAVLAKTLRVKEILTVPYMKNLVRATTDGKTHNVLATIVNMADYTVGADKGGNISMFDDFDIDYNQHKYLIETRCSGALHKPKSAMTIEEVV